MMKKLTRAYKRPWFLWIGGACFLVGSLVFSMVGVSSAGPQPSTVTANQGQGGSSAWKVDGSGVTQPVSGTVGIDSNKNTVKLDPSSAATVTSGDQTTAPVDRGMVVPAGGAITTDAIDTTAFKTIRVNIACLVVTSQVSWTITGDGGIVLVSGDCLSQFFSESFDVPGLAVQVNFNSSYGIPVGTEVVVDGRSN
jgi:hypothetical protein